MKFLWKQFLFCPLLWHTRIPDRAGNKPNALGLFLTSNHYIYFLPNVSSPIVNSDQCPRHEFIPHLDRPIAPQRFFFIQPTRRCFQWYPFHWSLSASLLSDDLTSIDKWGKVNLPSFDQGKVKQAVISHYNNADFPLVLMNVDELDTSILFTQLGLSFRLNTLGWKACIHSIAKNASQQLRALPEPRRFFSYSHLLAILYTSLKSVLP